MVPFRVTLAVCALCAACVVAGCATRPVIAEVDRNSGHRSQTRQVYDDDNESLVILAFSGGGTRAAAFAYGVLEERRSEIVGAKGMRTRMLDEVDVITGVSAGSFTALAYDLYGGKLFDSYEQPFLKRDVQGEPLPKATAVPIDRYSYEAVELLKDITTRWRTLRRLREARAFEDDASGPLRDAIASPDMDIYAVDVWFDALDDPAGVGYRNDPPTSFRLPPEPVDQLRAVAAKLVRQSPEFQRLVRDTGATIARRQ